MTIDDDIEKSIEDNTQKAIDEAMVKEDAIIDNAFKEIVAEKKQEQEEKK